MAGNLSRASQVNVLQRMHGYSTADLTATTMWLHLYNTTLNDAATPATTGRCAGANYDPVNVANTTATWTNPTSADPSAIENKSVITWTTDASTGWGTVQALMISSSSGTGGVAYWWMDVSPTQTVSENNTVQASTGAIDLTMT